MYKKLAILITDKLIRSNSAVEEKRAIYEYGFQLMFNALVNGVSFLTIALISKTFVPCLFFMIGFFAIRGLSGGFHASSPLKCYLLSTVSQVLFILIYNVIPSSLYLTLFSVVTLAIMIALFVFAPVDHKNKPFYGTEYVRFKKRSRIYALIIPFVMLPSFFVQPVQTMAFSYLFGSFVATFAMVAAKIIRIKETRNKAS